MKSLSISKLAGLLLIACSSATVLAQTYPSKIVKVIVPFPPGSGADTTLRLFTPKFTDQTGQPFLVDNRAGAAGNIGAEAAAKAPADGYNLLLVPASLATSASLYKDMKYDLIRDFAPISMLASAPFVMAVHPSVPAANYESATWFALFTPTGTPRDMVMQMNALANKTGQMHDVKDKLLAQGAEPQALTPEQVGAYALFQGTLFMRCHQCLDGQSTS